MNKDIDVLNLDGTASIKKAEEKTGFVNGAACGEKATSS
jgi:hypothetical protein